ncbi:G-coupled receptor -like protein [Brachionus plicatilis]|uniref:G-coupled receptor-like protein n=1 Tax=Brachionus plicatilis TaxID=10195 RepID=A0A3M7SHR9_BRAPC|nr:G-coupled receptor -like protein [Brachionus plicatilis]
MNSDNKTNWNKSDPINLNLHIESFYEFSKWINAILMTLIATVGLYGNTMSILIFCSKSYNKNSIKSLRLYLISLSASDLCVIVFHYVDFTFRQWVNLTASYDSKFNFVDKFLLLCKLVPYFRNVFRTISVYTLTLMTLQRLVLLHFPSLRLRWSSTKFNRQLLVGLLITALLINSTSLLINDQVKQPFTGELYCSVREDYVDMQFKIDIFFVIITILFPSIFILFLSIVLFLNVKKASRNGRVAKRSIQANSSLLSKKVLKYKNYFNYLNTRYPQMPNLENIQTIEIKKLNNIESGCAIEETGPNRVEKLSGESSKFKSPSEVFAIKKSLNQSIRTTYMLVIISKWFILLHLPYFLCWMLFHLSSNQAYFASLDPWNQNLSDFENLYTTRNDIKHDVEDFVQLVEPEENYINCDDVEEEDIESIFGSLKGSEYGSEFGDDNNEEESNDAEVEELNRLKNYESDEESYPHSETITIKESDFLVNGTDSDDEENCESDFEEVTEAICKLNLNPTKKKLEKLSKIASEAPIASQATQSAVKKALCKHKNPIACPECGKLMKNERGAKMHK